MTIAPNSINPVLFSLYIGAMKYEELVQIQYRCEAPHVRQIITQVVQEVSYDGRTPVASKEAMSEAILSVTLL